MKSSYSKLTPTLVSINVDNYDEVARWVLDRNSILYIDERHAPGFRISHGQPSLIMTDGIVGQPHGILAYIEDRCAPHRKLYPADDAKRKEVEELCCQFATEPDGNLREWVSRYTYSVFLPHKDITLDLMRADASFWESLKFRLFYKSRVKGIAEALQLGSSADEMKRSGEESLALVKKVFADVESRLGDGRRFLTGDTFTAADLIFAATAAPMVLPKLFGGAAPTLEEVPDDMREVIEEMRGTVAGKYILRLYDEERTPRPGTSELLPEPGILARMQNWLFKSSLGWKLRVWFFAFAAKRLPVLELGKNVYVNRYSLVEEVLTRDEDFTIKEINDGKMRDLHTRFFLGMDRSDPQYSPEWSLMQKIIRTPEDLEWVRRFVRQKAAEQIALYRDKGQLDTVTGLTRVVPVMLLDEYFGIPSPDRATMMRWMRTAFHQLFLNPSDDSVIHGKARRSADELKVYLEQLIAGRSQVGDNGEPEYRGCDNLLNRMLTVREDKETYSWLDDDAIRRNISGLIIGAVDTTSKCVTLVLDELLRRPRELEAACEAARNDDIDTVHKYAYEALRFNPHNPAVVRYSAANQKIGEKYKVPSNHTVWAAITPAMFDPEACSEPKKFDPNREGWDVSRYWHFGFAMHACYGRYLNAITIPELTAAVLRLDNLRRSSTRAGRSLDDGPFPNNFVVEFDA